MSNQIEELTYHGHPLIAQPVDQTLGQVCDQLRAGKLVEVILEPGDATRYDLLIAPVSAAPSTMSANVTALLVGRTTGRGGDFREGALVPDPEWDGSGNEFSEQIWRISGENDWSFQLLSWWFIKLWDRIEGRNQ